MVNSYWNIPVTEYLNRARRLCDQPYLSLHGVEQGVLDHYATVVFSDEFEAAVRANLDEALVNDLGSTQARRDQLEARLAALDT